MGPERPRAVRPGVDRLEQRLGRNDKSRNTAGHHREPWSDDETEALTELWDGTEETLEELAEMLGRTIEACRQRYYTSARGDTPRTRSRAATGPRETFRRVAPEVVDPGPVGWLYGTCSRCRRTDDVYADGQAALCEECRE